MRWLGPDFDSVVSYRLLSDYREPKHHERHPGMRQKLRLLDVTNQVSQETQEELTNLQLTCGHHHHVLFDMDLLCRVIPRRDGGSGYSNHLAMRTALFRDKRLMPPALSRDKEGNSCPCHKYLGEHASFQMTDFSNGNRVQTK